jgi:hypothetical protein
VADIKLAEIIRQFFLSEVCIPGWEDHQNGKNHSE